MASPCTRDPADQNNHLGWQSNVKSKYVVVNSFFLFINSMAHLPQHGPFPTLSATAKWYDRRDFVFVEFCVEDSKDVHVQLDKSKFEFR